MSNGLALISRYHLLPGHILDPVVIINCRSQPPFEIPHFVITSFSLFSVNPFHTPFKDSALSWGDGFYQLLLVFHPFHILTSLLTQYKRITQSLENIVPSLPSLYSSLTKRHRGWIPTFVCSVLDSEKLNMTWHMKTYDCVDLSDLKCMITTYSGPMMFLAILLHVSIQFTSPVSKMTIPSLTLSCQNL